MSWRFADDLTVADAGFEADGASLLELLGSAVNAALAGEAGRWRASVVLDGCGLPGSAHLS